MLGLDPLRIRPMESELGLLHKCDGSARVKQGNTSVLVGIWGPVEVRQSRELPDRAAVETSVRPATGQGTPRDKLFEHHVTQICEQICVTSQHPRTSIQVIVQLESEDGSVLAVTLNALCLALMDAGLPMKAMIGTVMCGVLEDGELMWDPTQDEEDECHTMYTFTYEGVDRKAVFIQCNGETDIEQHMLILQKGRQVADKLFLFYRESFEKLLRKDIKYKLVLPPVIKDEPM